MYMVYVIRFWKNVFICLVLPSQRDKRKERGPQKKKRLQSELDLIHQSLEGLDLTWLALPDQRPKRRHRQDVFLQT